MRAATSASPMRSGAAVAAYALVVVVMQLPWLTYAPVTEQAATTMDVSASAVGTLTVVVAVAYVVLGLPAGKWLDRYYGPTLAAGTLLAAGGTVLRAVDPSSFELALVGQCTYAAGAPLVLNAVTKLPARHLRGSACTTAIGLVSAGQFLGIMLAAATGPLLAPTDVTTLVRVHAVVLVAVSGVFLGSLVIRGRYEVAPTAPSLRRVLSHPQLRLLAAQMFIGLGAFNCAATWSDAIGDSLDHSTPGGVIITTLTGAGILGAMVLPPLAARRRRRRVALLAASIGTTVGLPLVLLADGDLLVVALAGVTGFVLMAGLPIALDWSEVIVGPEQAGATAAVLLVAGNVGGAVFVLVVQQVLVSPVLAVLTIAVLSAPWIYFAARQLEPTEPASRQEGVTP
ncbi:putative MFS family arabinose efflux permease [Nocardioides zeae]|uniref:MFS family arabinose efflux permease n=1 Tax=Nocardioides zeae TaxID=1457234 RepID=A0ACC6IEA0_9ACTN|nr:MFS transporter [Nocardioides zeae]MDR6209009.1 putative MFS family arabinose efflux permease [Nocardioides zeae]